VAGFRTHVTTSTVLGFGYGFGAYSCFDLPWESCVLSAGLCGVSGMLPDLDSGPGKPLRESLAFAAAVIPMMLFDRARQLGMSNESMALAGGAIYLGIRFGVGWLLRRYTVHRGMFHSLPAAIIATELAFLICTGGDIGLRCYKAGSVLLGFMSHLVLDEIWSIQIKGVTIGVKKSFGTAIKLWGDSLWANLSTYAKLAALTLLVFRDPIWQDVSPVTKELHRLANDAAPSSSEAGEKAVGSKPKSKERRR
jgi:hypothetical protein